MRTAPSPHSWIRFALVGNNSASSRATSCRNSWIHAASAGWVHDVCVVSSEEGPSAGSGTRSPPPSLPGTNFAQRLRGTRAAPAPPLEPRGAPRLQRPSRSVPGPVAVLLGPVPPSPTPATTPPGPRRGPPGCADSSRRRGRARLPGPPGCARAVRRPGSLARGLTARSAAPDNPGRRPRVPFTARNLGPHRPPALGASRA